MNRPEPSPADTGFSASLQLLATRRFGTFWFASLLSNIGTWAQQVAQPWLLLSLGASSVLIGLDAFAMNAPVWLLTLVGGLLADRADRRRVIAGFQSAQMLCPVLIVGLLVSGTLKPWMVVVLSLVVGITDALSMPSFSSIVPSIVRRDQIATGLALNSTQFNLSRIAGPALAGVLMAGAGAVGCFVVSALSYLPFIGVAVWILPGRPRNTHPPAPGGRPHLFSGLRVLTRQPQRRGALYTTFFSGLLCGPLITFCPVLVRDAFQGDASRFSVAVGAFGVGGLCGAIALLRVDPRRDRRSLASWCAMGLAMALIAIALTPQYWVLVAMLVAGGAAMSAANTSANTVLQSATSSDVRGQAVSLYMLAMRGGGALGSLLTGLSTHLLGVRMALLINGMLALLVQAFIQRDWLRDNDGAGSAA